MTPGKQVFRILQDRSTHEPTETVTAFTGQNPSTGRESGHKVQPNHKAIATDTFWERGNLFSPKESHCVLTTLQGKPEAQEPTQNRRHVLFCVCVSDIFSLFALIFFVVVFDIEKKRT